jgi:hypothetical protein
MEKRSAELVTKAYAIFVWISALFAILIALAILTGGGLASTFNTATGDVFARLGTLAAIIILIIALVEVLVGIGLWTLQPWARVAIIIVSILNLFSFPIGTIIGILGIYLFGFNDDVKALFGDRIVTRRSRAAAARRR